MHGRSIDNIDNVNVRPWDTFILPRTFLDLLYDTVAVPGSVLIKRVLLREKGMEGLEKPGGYSCVLLISFKFRLTIVLSASCLLERKKKTGSAATTKDIIEHLTWQLDQTRA